jgi:hypothetical protein
LDGNTTIFKHYCPPKPIVAPTISAFFSTCEITIGSQSIIENMTPTKPSRGWKGKHVAASRTLPTPGPVKTEEIDVFGAPYTQASRKNEKVVKFEPVSPIVMTTPGAVQSAASSSRHQLRSESGGILIKNKHYYQPDNPL